MGTVITLEDINAYAEVNYIIHHMNEKYLEMIPKQLVKFFESFSNPNYKVNINPHIPLDRQGLQRYSLEIIAILHLKYWCENEERKQELYNIMVNNENNVVQNLKYRSNIEELFNDVEDETIEENDNIDYSKPKSIQMYDNYSKENEDIKDYTDVIEDEEVLPANNEEKKSIFKSIKDFFLGLFKKL